MLEPKAGDRIERWLLTDDSAYAQPMQPPEFPAEEWDPSDYAGEDTDQFDPIVEFDRHIAMRYVDHLLVPSGAHVSSVYEMVACLPSQDPDGHTTYRVLMRLKSRTDPR